MPSEKVEQLKDLLNLQDRMNQIFKEVLQVTPAQNPNSNWSPLVDIFESNNCVIVKVDLPGVDSKDIQINIEGEHLTIKGQRNLPEKLEQDKIYRMERFYGSFQRHFTLSYDIDQESVDADYKDGVLTVTMTKLAPKVAKRIDVKVS